MDSKEKDRQIIKLYGMWQQAEIDNKGLITELIRIEFCDNKKVLNFIEDIEINNKNLFEVLENPKLLNEVFYLDNSERWQ